MPSPPSATGHRSAGRPAPCSPRPIAAATSVALNVPLNESGATSTVSGTPGMRLTARGQLTGSSTKTGISRSVLVWYSA